MRYVRTYAFSAAHFNSRRSYETAWSIVAAHEMKDEGKPFPDLTSICRMMRDVHGHNFKCEVAIDGNHLENKEGWIVDDVALEKAIMEYAGINVSMHPDFMTIKARATTEVLAQAIFDRVMALLEGTSATCVHVKLWETDDIYAVAHG